jgi:hypothetical protein
MKREKIHYYNIGLAFFVLQIGSGVLEKQLVDFGCLLVFLDDILNALEFFVLGISDKLE